MDAALAGVSFRLPGGCFAAKFFRRTDAAVQALAAENAQFDFRYVKPTAVAGSMNDL